jgi:cell filamentation protein, protein adenylyltransferase
MNGAPQMLEPDLSNAVRYHYEGFPPQNLEFGRLIDPAIETAAALSRYDQMLSTMHNSEILLAPLRQQEAVVSSRMEGTISTLDEILQIEAEQDSGDREAFARARTDAVETFLYARAMRQVQSKMNEGQRLSEFLIRSAHQILLSFGRGAQKSPGSYKSEQNYIGERRRNSVSFVPISPESLPSGMQALMRFTSDKKITPLLRIAIAHVEFEALHPFEDGNGRIGRMLITLMLWDLGIIRAPHFYVSAYFEETRDDYIDLMRRVSSHGDWTEWCLFFLEGLRAQARRNIETAEKVFGLYEEMKTRFREELNSQWAGEAVDFMFANPTFRNNKFTKMTDIPPHVAMTMTRKLRDTGLIRQVSPPSGRRPAMYSFEPLLEIVRKA